MYLPMPSTNNPNIIQPNINIAMVSIVVSAPPSKLQIRSSILSAKSAILLHPADSQFQICFRMRSAISINKSPVHGVKIASERWVREIEFPRQQSQSVCQSLAITQRHCSALSPGRSCKHCRVSVVALLDTRNSFAAIDTSSNSYLE